MVASAHCVDSKIAVRQVNQTLRGPVIEILAQLVPELKTLPGERAYQRTLDDIGLLERCFQAFRGNRERFSPVLLDRDRKPADGDSTILTCGRTLDDVVAMVVRTAAKRYFRRRHDPQAALVPVTSRLRRDVKAKGFAHRMASLFKAERPQPAHPPAAKAHQHADALYQAIREYLRHDWQVPMVPTYAEMNPALIRSLGAKILDVRELDHLKRIAADPEEAAKLFDLPKEEAAPAVEPPPKDNRARLSSILTPDGTRLNADTFEGLLLRPHIRKHLPAPTQTLRNLEILRSVGAVPVKLLVAELGLTTDQLTVVLLVAQEALGPENFTRMFGRPGDAATVMRLTQRVRQAGIGQSSSLEECAEAIRRLFGNLAASRSVG